MATNPGRGCIWLGPKSMSHSHQLWAEEVNRGKSRLHILPGSGNPCECRPSSRSSRTPSGKLTGAGSKRTEDSSTTAAVSRSSVAWSFSRAGAESWTVTLAAPFLLDTVLRFGSAPLVAVPLHHKICCQRTDMYRHCSLILGISLPHLVPDPPKRVFIQ